MVLFGSERIVLAHSFVRQRTHARFNPPNSGVARPHFPNRRSALRALSQLGPAQTALCCTRSRPSTRIVGVCSPLLFVMPAILLLASPPRVTSTFARPHSPLDETTIPHHFPLANSCTCRLSTAVPTLPTAGYTMGPVCAQDVVATSSFVALAELAGDC